MSELDLDAAIEASVRALLDKQWNPYFERSAHVHHTHNGDCAICMGALDMIAGVVIAAAAPLIEAETRRKVAEEIETEFVCCDIAERIKATDGDHKAVARLMARGSGYHPICHWGGTAAAIARGGNEQTREET